MSIHIFWHGQRTEPLIKKLFVGHKKENKETNNSATKESDENDKQNNNANTNTNIKQSGFFRKFSSHAILAVSAHKNLGQSRAESNTQRNETEDDERKSKLNPPSPLRKSRSPKEVGDTQETEDEEKETDDNDEEKTKHKHKELKKSKATTHKDEEGSDKEEQSHHKVLQKSKIDIKLTQTDEAEEDLKGQFSETTKTTDTEEANHHVHTERAREKEEKVKGKEKGNEEEETKEEKQSEAEERMSIQIGLDEDFKIKRSLRHIRLSRLPGQSTDHLHSHHHHHRHHHHHPHHHHHKRKEDEGGEEDNTNKAHEGIIESDPAHLNKRAAKTGREGKNESNDDNSSLSSCSSDEEGRKKTKPSKAKSMGALTSSFFKWGHHHSHKTEHEEGEDATRHKGLPRSALSNDDIPAKNKHFHEGSEEDEYKSEEELKDVCMSPRRRVAFGSQVKQEDDAEDQNEKEQRKDEEKKEEDAEQLGKPSSSVQLVKRQNNLIVHMEESVEDVNRKQQQPPKSILKRTGVWRHNTHDQDQEEETEEDEEETDVIVHDEQTQTETEEAKTKEGEKTSTVSEDDTGYSYSEGYYTDSETASEPEGLEGLPLYEEDEDDKNTFIIIVKGAPETIFPMCDTVCLHGRVFHLSHRSKDGREQELRSHLLDFYSEIGNQFEVNEPLL